MYKKRMLFITQAALIAALYVALTYLSSLVGLDKGVVQLRLSEVLTVLPYFSASSIPGLFIGCLLANQLTGALPLDVLFGSLATLLGALGTRYIGRKCKWLAAVPPIVANMIVVPLVLRFVYAIDDAIPYFMLTVGAGELVMAGVLGTMFLLALEKHRKNINWV